MDDINIPGFKFLKVNRSKLSSEKVTGGGLAVYLKDDIKIVI